MSFTPSHLLVHRVMGLVAIVGASPSPPLVVISIPIVVCLFEPVSGSAEVLRAAGPVIKVVVVVVVDSAQYFGHPPKQRSKQRLEKSTGEAKVGKSRHPEDVHSFSRALRVSGIEAVACGDHFTLLQGLEGGSGIFEGVEPRKSQQINRALILYWLCESAQNMNDSEALECWATSTSREREWERPEDVRVHIPFFNLQLSMHISPQVKHVATPRAPLPLSLPANLSSKSGRVD